jgi:GT2 family glycosyltransferase
MITVICLSYQRPALLRRALQSIECQSRAPDRILVVDNFSARSGEVAAVVREFPRVQLQANPDNRGFAGGMNTGLAMVSAGRVLLTEDDLELAPDCLANFETRQAEADLLGGVLVDVETGVVEWAGGRLNFETDYWGTSAYLTRMPQPSSEEEVLVCDFVSGCLLFGDIELFRRDGGFRRDFFVYGEDVEFCARLRARKRRVAVIPSARALHLAPHHRALSGVVAWHHEKNYLANWFLYPPVWRLPEAFLRFYLVRLIRCALRGDGSSLLNLGKALGFWLPRAGLLWKDRRGKRVSREAQIATDA